MVVPGKKTSFYGLLFSFTTIALKIRTKEEFKVQNLKVHAFFKQKGLNIVATCEVLHMT